MKKKLTIALLAMFVISAAAPTMAHRYRRAQNDHPMRLVAYVLHPVGIAVEYAVMRPIHELVSQPDLDIWFGHESSKVEEGTYYEWTHGDFEPSIAAEREQKNQQMKAEESEESGEA